MPRARKIEPETDQKTLYPTNGRQHSASYTRLRGEPLKWFVRVVGPHALKFSGRDIPVATKNGVEHEEKMGRLLGDFTDQDTGQPVGIYEFIAKPKASPEELDDVIPF